MKVLGFLVLLCVCVSCSAGQGSPALAPVSSSSLDDGGVGDSSSMVGRAVDADFESAASPVVADAYDAEAGDAEAGDAESGDAEENSATSRATPGRRRVTLAATGDLVFSRRLVKTWEAMGEDGLAQMLAGYASLIREDEITMLNLETPLVDDVVPIQTGWPPVIGAPPGVADVLADIGVDFVSIANNHSYDQGHLGLTRTMALLDAVEIAHAGAGPSADDAFGSRVLDWDGVRVAFLSFTDVMNIRVGARGAERQTVARLWDEERVLESIRRAREGADLVVACLHWSRDFQESIARAQRRRAEALIEAGADVLIGTGPHLLQEVERRPSPRGEAVVAYSLGNLLSSMAFRWSPGEPVARGYVHPANVIPGSRDGVLLRITVELDDDGGVHIAAITAVPLWTINTVEAHREGDAPMEIRVVPLSDAPALAREERLPRITSALGDQVVYE